MIDIVKYFDTLKQQLKCVVCGKQLFFSMDPMEEEYVVKTCYDHSINQKGRNICFLKYKNIGLNFDQNGQVYEILMVNDHNKRMKSNGQMYLQYFEYKTLDINYPFDILNIITVHDSQSWLDLLEGLILFL